MGWKSGVWAAACAATIAAIVLLGALLGDRTASSASAATQPMLPITAPSRCSWPRRGSLWKRELGVLLVLGGAISLAYGLSGSEGSAVNTAVCMILLGAGLLCLDRRPGLADMAAVLVAVIAGLALLGYLFDVPELRRGLHPSPLTPMAVPTWLALLALSSGLLSARSRAGSPG